VIQMTRKKKVVKDDVLGIRKAHEHVESERLARYATKPKAMALKDPTTGLLSPSRFTHGNVFATKFKPTKSLKNCNSKLCRLVRIIRIVGEPKRASYLIEAYNRAYNAKEKKSSTLEVYLSRMATWGYIERFADPTDKRSTLYRLSDKADEICKCDGSATAGAEQTTLS